MPAGNRVACRAGAGGRGRDRGHLQPWRRHHRCRRRARCSRGRGQPDPARGAAQAGKTDRLDAYRAARSVLSGEATTDPKNASIEPLRALKRCRSLSGQGPAGRVASDPRAPGQRHTHIRDRYRDLPDANLTATLASTRPDRLGDNDAAGTMSALSALARRHQSLETETAELEERMSARATVASPSAETRPRPRGRPRPGRALRRPRLLRPAARPPSQVTRPHRRGRAPRGVARPDRGTRAQKPPQRRTRHPLPRLAQRRLTRLTRSRSMSPAIGPEGTCERAVGREAFAIGSPALLGGTFRSCAG
jgi:hypothetical protein